MPSLGGTADQAQLKVDLVLVESAQPFSGCLQATGLDEARKFGAFSIELERIAIDPASITVIRYSGERPTVVRVNLSAEGAAAGLVDKPKRPSLLGRLRGEG